MKEKIQKAAEQIWEAEAVLIGASNGLSIAEGYHIFADNEDFQKYFGYYRETYGIDCLIRGVFARFPEHDRYMCTVHKYLIEDYGGSQVMKRLLGLVGDKDYFVVTSNADTHFQINGFDPSRIFEVEGNLEGMEMGGSQWKGQRERFQSFVEGNKTRSLVVLELGIGRRNTLIKKPLMDLVADNPGWHFVTLNLPGEIYVPQEISDRSMALEGDIGETFAQLERATAFFEGRKEK